MIWEEKTWTAPDGKVIPYQEATLNLDELLYATDYMESLTVTICKWPKNVKVTAFYTESIDVDDPIHRTGEWTQDGDGDGYIDPYIQPAYRFPVFQVTRAEWETEGDREMQGKIYSILKKAYHEVPEFQSLRK